MKTDPTVGRVMLYFPNYGSSHKTLDDAALTAHVAKVNADGTVNIAYHDQEGNSHAAQNVQVVQFGEAIPGSVAYVTWMPYQAGAQHAKNATNTETRVTAEAEKKA